MEELQKIPEELKQEFKISPQAERIIKSIPDFPFEHFRKFWIQHYGGVNGSQLHHYLSANDGLSQTIEAKQ